MAKKEKVRISFAFDMKDGGNLANKDKSFKTLNAATSYVAKQFAKLTDYRGERVYACTFSYYTVDGIGIEVTMYNTGEFEDAEDSVFNQASAQFDPLETTAYQETVDTDTEESEETTE